jgi:hypothetical protein
MGFWDFIFGKKKAIIEDDFFGKLTIDDNFTESNQYFAPANKSIELLLSFENGRPNEAQKAFYQSIEQNYEALVPKFIATIEKGFIEYKDNFKIKDLDKEFELLAIDLPICNSIPIDWEIHFDQKQNENDYYFLCILMKDFEVEDIRISH